MEQMYICLECGKLFEFPQNIVERHGLDFPPYERKEGCPFCGGAFCVTFRCAMCHSWITGSYVQIKGGDKICSDCYTEFEIGG